MRVVADLAEKYSFDEARVSTRRTSCCRMCGATMFPRFSPCCRRTASPRQCRAHHRHHLPAPASIIARWPPRARSPRAGLFRSHFADPAKQKDIGEFSIKISGCINACGHHHVGNIGILGLEKQGANPTRSPLAATRARITPLGELLGPGLPAELVPEAIDRVIGVYLRERQPGESFIEAYRRLGLAPFKAAFKEIADAVA